MIGIVGGAVAGAMSWGAAEYLLHRFVGHRPSGRSAFAVEHRRHHSQGNYFAPTRKKALAVTPVLLATLGAGTAIAGAPGTAYAAGLMAAYVGYEFFHRRLHTHPPRNAFGRWARRHHFFHHYGNPKMNHGVTSPVMDLLFGSRVVPPRIRVPRKLAMPWLVDASGAVRPEFSMDYEIAGPLRVETPAALAAGERSLARG